MAHMSTVPKSRWKSRIAGGAIAGATSMLMVWAMERAFHIPDPHFVRLILATFIGAIVGVLGRMFVDEVAQQ
jgi:hypothetical protein